MSTHSQSELRSIDSTLSPACYIGHERNIKSRFSTTFEWRIYYFWTEEYSFADYSQKHRFCSTLIYQVVQKRRSTPKITTKYKQIGTINTNIMKICIIHVMQQVKSLTSDHRNGLPQTHRSLPRHIWSTSHPSSLTPHIHTQNNVTFILPMCENYITWASSQGRLARTFINKQSGPPLSMRHRWRLKCGCAVCVSANERL